MPWLILIGLLWACSVVVMIAGLSRHRSVTAVRSRLDSVAGQETALAAGEAAFASASLYETLAAPLLTRLGGLMAWTTPTLSTLDGQLTEAGRPMNMQPVELLGLKVVVSALFALVMGGLSFMVDIGFGARGFTLLLLPFIGFTLPSFVLRRMAISRRREIRYSLPDMLDLLIINIEAGVGLDGAIARAVERLHMPLTYELNRVLSEMQSGKPRVQALREMAERLRIEDLSLIIASIQQSEQLGSSIGHALRQRAEQMRRRRSNELREIAAKLPTKLLIPIVLFIFPTLFMVLLGPGLIQMMRAEAF